jgi:hypothetical protein
MEKFNPEFNLNRKQLAIYLAIGVVAICSLVSYKFTHESSSNSPVHPSQPQIEKPISVAEHKTTYPDHKEIIATTFWVGEEGDESNDFIQNKSSAWLDDWMGSFGGVDDPENRCGYSPCNVNLKENPFYFALPYNDLNDQGVQKASAKNIPWYNPSAPKDVSQLKNHWIEVTNHAGKKAYAQWEDVGPFGEEDFNYVFGDQRPEEKRAGLDLSPGATDYLNLNGQEKVDWHFIDASGVPDGPWKKIITKS